MKSIHHLVEIGPRNFFWEFSSLGNEVKEFSSSNELENDGKTTVSSFIFVLIGGVFPHTD
jgi:hypothetical protein